MRSDATRRWDESPVELWEDLSHELWQVQHGVGEARLMTLDEIDAAFKREEINARTLVRKAGSLKWRTLGEIAGLTPSAPEPPPSTTTLGSETLIPVTSEVACVAPKAPKPPPLPCKAKEDMTRVAFAPTMIAPPIRRPRTDVGFAKVDDVDVLKLDAAKEQKLSIPDGIDRELRFSHEELSAARPRSVVRTMLGIAVVSLVGGGVFAGVSAWLSGAFGNGNDAAAAIPALATPHTSNELTTTATTASNTTTPNGSLVQKQTAAVRSGKMAELGKAAKLPESSKAAATEAVASAQKLAAPAVAPPRPSSTASVVANGALQKAPHASALAQPGGGLHARMASTYGGDAKKKGLASNASPPQQKTKSDGSRSPLPNAH